MKYTVNQLENGIILSYLNNSGIAHSAQEAEAVINSFSNGRENLVVNNATRRSLVALFEGQEVSSELKTTNCSKYAIKHTPALASTLEEHIQLFQAQQAKEREARKQAAAELHAQLQEDFQREAKGWYFVSVEVVALDKNMKRRYLTLDGYTLAGSKMNAYEKMTAKAAEDCIAKGCTLESVEPWNSIHTDVDYIGTLR